MPLHYDPKSGNATDIRREEREKKRKHKNFNSKTNLLFAASVGFFFGVSFTYSNANCSRTKCPNVECPEEKCPNITSPIIECPKIECPICSCPTPEKSTEELIQQNCNENDNKAEHGFVEETESIDFKE